MSTIEIQVRRFSVVSSRPFEEIVSRVTATIGRPDMNAFHGAVAAARTLADLEKLVQGVIGSSGLMEFVRFDAGEILRKEHGGQGPKILAPGCGQSAHHEGNGQDRSRRGIIRSGHNLDR